MNVLKKIFLIIASFLLIVFLSSFLATRSFFRGKNLRVPFDGDTSRSKIVDDAEMFNDAEEDVLNDYIRKYSADLGINIIIYVSGTPVSDSETQDFTANTYDQLMGQEFTDGVLYYMDFSGKKPAYDYLWCSGKAAVIYGEEPPDITDKVVPYLPPSSKTDITNEDIVPGIKEFLNVLVSYNDKYSQSDLYYTKDNENHIYFFDTGSDFYVTKKLAPGARFYRFVASFLVGYILMLIIYFATKSKYKFKNKTNPSIYVAKNETTFSANSDTFIRTYTTKTKIESSSGGSRGGGHHSGGHSGGGRGGGSHR